MTKEQLQAARAAHWRQNERPLLTLEDAQGWFEEHPLCLYLPRHAQLPAPAPSFVEACLRSTRATPTADAIAQAQGLLTRLVAAGTVVAMNLLGGLGEQPDFLASTQALPFVLALRADPDWKHAPQKTSGHKVSPLVLELWRLLDKDGVLTAAEAREALGRELTEAAVLRALGELWQGLRVSPVFGDAGEPARWELLRVRHREALATAGATSQVTALSLMVSMYLQSAYTATADEIEIFLSPLASRSRVREAVRGLSATRQIHSLSMEAQTYYFLEDGLPEFAPPAAVVPETAPPARPERARRVSPPPLPRPLPRNDRAAWPERSTAPAAPAAAPARGRPPAAASAGRGARTQAKPAQPWGKKTEWKKPRPPSAPGRGAEARTGGRPDTRGGARPGTRGPARPETRGGARPEKRPGGWAGAQKARPTNAWARPRPASGSAPRPSPAGGDAAQRPRPDRPRDAQNNRGQTRPVPGPATGRGGPSRKPFRPRPAGNPQAPVDPGRAGSYVRSDRPSGRPAGRTASPSGVRPKRDGQAWGGKGRDRKGPGGPAKSWPRANGPARKPGGKPGKPPASFRGRKPDRNKPGV